MTKPATSLVDIAREVHDEADMGSKPVYMYERYMGFLEPLVRQPITLLELGIHKGESLKIFASYFKNGKIVGVDIVDTKVDVSQYSNIAIEVCDQRDGARLAELSDKHAPEGFDIIIDDASHFGAYSRLSFDALFPKLKSGGLYVVEDWGTGYWDDWPDGGRYERFHVQVHDGQMPRRIPSHDMGMVGFVKSLIDGLFDKPTSRSNDGTASPKVIDWISINQNFAIMKKV